MKNDAQEMTEKIVLLKAGRLLLLKIHKSLIDIKRAEYERRNGVITSGQFLNLLLQEPDFQWLRKFSALVVEIDEMLDLDDGFSEAMTDNLLSQTEALINFETGDKEFEEEYLKYLQIDSDTALRHSELKKLLS